MWPNIDGLHVRQRMARALRFMNLLRVEPYLFLITFQTALKVTPDKQLLEDKICLNWYNQSYDYCYNMPTTDETGTGHGHFKSQILADGTVFGTYPTYISTVPSLIWALFIGGWIDRYVKARKLMMILYVASLIVETAITICLTLDFNANVYYILATHLPSSLLGGMLTYRVITIHYVTSMSQPKMMALRFMIFEIVAFIASPMGSSLSGYLITQDPLFDSYGEIRNYTLIYIIALASNVLGLLWAVFMIDEGLARRQELQIQRKILGIRDSSEGEHMTIKVRSDMTTEDRERHPLQLLFDIENVKSMVRTCIKCRPDRVRTQLFLLFPCLLFFVIAYEGPAHISSAFEQLVYHWSPDMQAYMKSINMFAHFILTVTLVPVIIKVLKVPDMQLAIIGFVSSSAKYIFTGSWLDPLSNYISIVITSMGGLAVVGMRSHLTRIVDRDEIGKVMSVVSAFDTFGPMISGTLFTFVFNNTIDSYPGITYQMNGLLLIIPIYAVMWIDVYCKRPVLDDHAHNDIEAVENKNISGHSGQGPKKEQAFCSRL